MGASGGVFHTLIYTDTVFLTSQSVISVVFLIFGSDEPVPEVVLVLGDLSHISTNAVLVQARV